MTEEKKAETTEKVAEKVVDVAVIEKMEEKVEEKDELFSSDEKKLTETKTQVPTEVNMDQEDLMLPRYQLMQATSGPVQAGEATPGKIRHSITGELFDKIQVVVLGQNVTRIMFDPENRQGTPKCMSADGKVGNMGNCQTCTEKDFSKGADGRSLAPSCNKAFNFITIRADELGENAMPTILTFMKSSINAGKKIKTSSAGWIKPLPLWNFIWEIGVNQKSFAKGPASVLTANQVRATTDEEKKFLDEVASRFANADIAADVLDQ